MGSTPVVTKGQTCTCAEPVPVVRAVRKGAARTHCQRCGLPIRLAFGSR
jgi:hypothetical protein